MRDIVGHQSGDLDCFGSQWMLRYYLDPFAVVRYEPMNNYDQEALDNAWAVVDMGGVYDPDHLRFDHHGSDLPSATMLVYQWLVQYIPRVEAIEPLVRAINAWDVGPLDRQMRDVYESVGLHGQLEGFRLLHEIVHRTRPSDHECFEFVSGMLDRAAVKLERIYEGKQWRQYAVYISDANSLVALEGGAKEHTEGAHRDGFRVVLFHNTDLEGRHTIGVHGDGSVDVVALTNRVLQTWPDRPVVEEIETWYRTDTRGFFAGRTAKGGRHTLGAPKTSLERIAFAFDITWSKGRCL